MLRKFIPVLMFAAITSGAFANEEHHPAGSNKPAASSPANRPTSAVKAVPKKTAGNDTETQFDASRAQMKKMLGQMEKIRQTRDPRERQSLMQEHLQTMYEQAQAMRGMSGGMMMDMMNCPMMGDKGNGQSCPMMGSSTGKMEPDKRVDMMEKRMDMMQMMMEQMIEREMQKTSMPSMP